MATLLQAWRAKPSRRSLSLDDYVALLNSFSYQGVRYTLPGASQEEIEGNFAGLTRYAYKQSGVVFACMLSRQLLFSEARFQYRRNRNGRLGNLWGNEGLRPLEVPWPGGTTADLLSRMEQDASLGGNSFTARQPGNRLFRMRPDWVDIILGSRTSTAVKAWDPEAEVLGYAYTPGGRGSGNEPSVYLAEEVAHYAPIPDPEAMYRGMSWLQPVVRELMADKAATEHKLKLFENGATPNLVVKLDVADLDIFEKWMDMFDAKHAGAANAYKTMYLGAGADATVVGADLQQLEFKATQGAGETRIAAAAGVPPVIVGLSEGLQAATYSNYGQARRRFADGTMRPLWRSAAGALASVVQVPSDSVLWYDDRDIAFLREDKQAAADIQAKEAQTIRNLVDSGFEPASVTAAVLNSDFSRLVHTGLYSVQLQPPKTAEEAAAEAEAAKQPSNGAVPDEEAQGALAGATS